MDLKQRQDDRFFVFCFLIISSGLLCQTLFVRSEPVCYAQNSLDERNRYITIVDCGGSDKICRRFSSREEVNVFEINAACGFPEDSLPLAPTKTYEAITCQQVHLPTVKDGCFKCSGYSVGDECNLTCNDGYYPSSSNETICKENKEFKTANWTVGNFECTAITCQQVLPTVNDGNFNCSGYSVGDKCNLTCKDGYYPSSSNETVCKENKDFKTANWTVGNFECSEITCLEDDLPQLLSGQITCPPAPIQEEGVCNFYCDGESYPFPSSRSVCKSSGSKTGGEWIPANISCRQFQCAKWNEWNGGEYKYIKNPKTWDESQQLCVQNSAHIVKIENEEENDFVQKGISHCSEGDPTVWIGLKKEGDEWKWHDGTRPWYENWKAGEPDGQECGTILASKWYDRLCDGQTFFVVCERKKPL